MENNFPYFAALHTGYIYYQDNGLLLQAERSDGQLIKYGYDKASRQTSFYSSDGSEPSWMKRRLRQLCCFPMGLQDDDNHNPVSEGTAYNKNR